MTASYEGHVDIVETLIEAKAQLNTQKEVWFYYYKNIQETIKFYCTHKMCLYPQNGWTALHLAAQGGRVEVVRLLAEAKAQINIQTEVYTLHAYITCMYIGYLK